MSDLQAFIMATGSKVLTRDDVMRTFWDDGDTLDNREAQLRVLLEDAKARRGSLPRGQWRAFTHSEVAPLNTELKQIKATRKARMARVRLAFNQLFLAGKVKIMPFRRPDLPTAYSTAMTFDEYKAWRIRDCEAALAANREDAAKEPVNILLHCWVGNLEDYLQSYKDTEILERRRMDKTLLGAYRPAGALLCVGGLCDDVWPWRIAKPDKSNGTGQGQLFDTAALYAAIQEGNADTDE